MFISNGEVSCNLWLDILILTVILQQVIDQHTPTRWYWSVLARRSLEQWCLSTEALTDTQATVFRSAESQIHEAECIFSFFCPDRWILKVHRLSWRLIDVGGQIQAESSPKVEAEDPDSHLRQKKYTRDWRLNAGFGAC